jgi:hypothetical protein
MLDDEFQCIRDELNVPHGFPPEVMAEAEVQRGLDRRSATTNRLTERGWTER